MNKTERRALVTGIVAAEILSIYCYVRSIDSTLIEDSFREQPAEWQLRKQPESAGVLDGRYVVFLEQYSPEILAAAKKYDVSPVLIDAAIVEENDGRPLTEDWKDDIALAWNRTIGHVVGYTIDASLGIGQVKMSTAQFLDSTYHRKPKTGYELEEALQNPAQSIEYIAMNLGYLTERDNRQPPSGNILDDPHLVAVIGTEYVRGPTKTSLEEAEISIEGGAGFAQAVGMIPTQKIHNQGTSIIDPTKQDKIYDYAQGIVAGYNRGQRTTLRYKILYEPDSIGAGM
jgi:hypothetical protein